MSLSIVVNGGGTFTASMEEGPVSFTASLGAVPGPTGATGPAGVVAATAPILYDSGTQTVSIDPNPTFNSVTTSDVFAGIVEASTHYRFPDSTLQTTAFVGEARKVYITARNNTGTTIAKGKVVRLSGATGNHPTIALAQANTEGNSSRTIGITVEAIANNAEGKVIISGAAENIDTSDFNAGDTVHLSSSVAGGLQLALPVAPLHGVVVGIVTRANPSVGSIEVAINNYQELEELSDILIASKANNDLLAWDSTGSVWKNKTFATLGLLTSATAASTYAPIASPTFTGTVTIPAGASISGFAPLESPTFTGTPTLPTGTIAVTQAAGNSTTAVATTAFVQQEVPAASTSAAGKVELATILEAHTGSSTTLCITPDDLAFRIHSGSTLYYVATDSTASVSSGTTSTSSQGLGTRCSTGSGSFGMRIFEGTATSGFASTVGGTTTVLSFDKRMIFSGKANVSSASDAGNYAQRVQFGKTQTSTTIGNLAVKGVGIRSTGAGNALNLLVHNGSALAEVTSTFTPSAGIAFDWQIYSDGAGNVMLFVNGSSVATSSAGPTGASTSLATVTVETEATAAVSAAANSGFSVSNLRVSFDL